MRRRAKFATVAALGVAGVVGLPAQAQAATFTVTTTDDTVNGDGETSLREAIADANANSDADVITFDTSLSGDITLNGTEIGITNPVEIQGPGADELAVDAHEASRIFKFNNAGASTISGLTLTGGKSTYARGGAIDANGGSLTISDSTLAGNSTYGGASPGGAIASNSAPLTISDSTLSGNWTSGGSFSNGGAIYANGGSLTISDSTLSGNSTESSGGAIFSSGQLSADSVTIADNHGLTGGGIALTGAPADLTNTIVADNTAPSGPDLSSNGSGEFNLTSSLVEDTSDATVNYGSDSITGLDPQLNPLADYGGPTETQAIPDTSPAYDAGATDLTADQRGVNRPQGDADDIGAYELRLPSFTVTTTNDTVDIGDGETSLREAIADANATSDPDVITFDAAVSGNITLNGTLLGITEPVEIQGPGADELAIDAHGASRIAYFEDAGSSTISGLTLAGGNGISAKGGAIYANNTSLTITDSTISGNSTSGDDSNGGAIYARDGLLKIAESTISGNSTSGEKSYGGAIYTNNAPLTITDSTLSGNSTSGDKSYGGAIQGHGGSMTIKDSTLSGNSTTGYHSHGGAIASTASLSAYSVTIADNHVTSGGGGGIVEFNDTADLTNTIVADNTATISPDLYGVYGGQFTLTSSLVEDTSGATVTSGSDSITGLDPQLGPLADNGGPTKTQAIPVTSPALEAGATDLPADQRGVTRPQGEADDIGAFEQDDFTGPSTQVGPLGTTTNPRPEISFSSPDIDGDLDGFECRLDSSAESAFTTCSSPFRPDSDLADGTHTLEVRAVDESGNRGPVASEAFTVDTSGPPPPPPLPSPGDSRVSDPFAKALKTQKQKGKRIVVKIKGGASEAVEGFATGKLTLEGSKKKLPLKAVHGSSAPRQRAVYKLKLKKKQQDKQVFKLLKKGKKVKAKTALTLTDPAGNSATEKLTVRLGLNGKKKR